MTLDLRTDEPVVGLARQRELIQAVLEASSADETRWLEWKSNLDVSKAEGAFAVSKAILGFANRMPDIAQQWAEGHAYLLVGVEEGALYGVPKYDVEKVDPWLSRYIGNFGRYQLTYVPFDYDGSSFDVMLVDVFSPRWGDPIHPLRKDFQNFRAGTVFHRYAGRTAPASAAEIDALSERARRAAKRTNIDIAAIAGAVALVPPSTDALTNFISTLREELMKQVQTSHLRNKATGGTPLNGYIDSFLGFSTDPRTPEDFEEEVEEYLSDLGQAMQNSLLQKIGTVGAPLALKLTNPGDENLTKVEVVLSFPETVMACVADDVEVDWPDLPEQYGSSTSSISARAVAGIQVNSPAFRLPDLHAPEIVRGEGRTFVRFAPVDLRPHETIALDSITLYSTTDDSASEIDGEWWATATNASGKACRRLVIPIERLEIDVMRSFLPGVTGKSE
ncbi:hypothetical protein [Streptomyces cyaneofuscatus]|uniref:hypothetical protein n=1 Tax=Streptomyces cyaneofuscatus TaxID=66883 RepID=UPI0033AF06BD